ncbi:MAG: cupin domain-containing protein [Gammaproteobacteria bacterium]|nr:cupin domain-containing protein [Gammaproteobacteria bacterium]MDH5653832.1 cupin domain-containing protein [Gammaproteobacteria bacterium]
MQTPEHILGNTPLSTFLAEYWQQKPLLIRSAIKHYVSPISADEMAGLACEEEVESRIILERDGDHPWQCLHGPFAESVFAELPATHWTLLLQSLNLHIPAFADLLERFRFIPNWRVDDVMVSYAAPGGSVGPHTDNYDVFLLQAQGKRRWEISTRAVADEDFIPDLGLKVLTSFEAEQGWVLEAGDMLYLPPGVIHHGVAVDDVDSGDCITVSIGFRAPSLTELAGALLDEVLAQDSISLASDQGERFYQDPQLPLQENPGEITQQALAKIKQMVLQELQRRLEDSDWFGKFITHTPEAFTSVVDETDFDAAVCLEPFKAGVPLVRNEAAKPAYFITDQAAQDRPAAIHFFINGRVGHYPLTMLPLIQLVCNQRHPPPAELSAALTDAMAEELLARLIYEGFFEYLDDEDDSF